jgi:hypothetical protein
MKLSLPARRPIAPARAAFGVPARWAPHVVARGSDEEAAAREASTRIVKVGILFALVCMTVLDRFGLSLSASYSVAPCLIGLYGLVLAIVFSGAARLSTTGALTYVMVFAVTAASYLVTASDDQRGFVSIGSMMLLLVLYAPLTLSLSKSVATPELFAWTMKWYVRFSLAIAIFGIVQFYAQFVIRAPWVFDWRLMIPAAIRGSGNYNTLNPAGEMLKANGFFLREASGFSFLMAFALLCEMYFGKRKWVMATFGLAVMLSYSGSGILALAVAFLFQSGRKLLVQGACAAVVATLVFTLFGEALHLNYTVDRLSEFDSSATKSSAYCRFVAPGKLAADEINSGRWSALLGHGPGTTQKMFDVCETTYGKVIFEYGLVGMVALTIMILCAINRGGLPLRIRVMFVVEWYLLGGNLLAPEPLLAIFFLSSMWPVKVGAPAPAPATTGRTSRRWLFDLAPRKASRQRMFDLS